MLEAFPNWSSGARTVAGEWNPKENTVSYDRARYTHTHTASENNGGAYAVATRVDAATQPAKAR